MCDRRKIDEIARIIFDISKAKDVYLFGSHARGNPDKNSDIDIAIIKKKIRDKHKELYSLRKSLFAKWVPMDLVMFEEADFKKNREILGTLQHEIYKTGKKLSGK